MGRLVAIAAVLAALASTVTAIGEGAERAEAGDTRPNVVLVVVDDQARWSLDGLPVLGGSEWVRFPNAFANNPLCCPSRATILSGRYSHHTGVENNQDGVLFDDRSTIAQWLRRAGYETALVGKYLNEYPFGRAPFVPRGWDHWKAFNGQTAYYDYSLIETRPREPLATQRYGSQAKHYSTDLLAKKATRLLQQFGDDPFFLYFAPFAPHGPRTAANRHDGAGDTIELPLRPNFNEEDVSDKPAWVQALPLADVSTMERKQRDEHEAMLAVDEAVGTMIDTLAETGELENTVFLYISDNGFSYGAHRWEKKSCPYEECINTPILVRGAAWAGRTEPALASNVDLAPTIADIAGVNVRALLDGLSLVPVLEDSQSSVRDAVLIHNKGFSGWWGVRTATHTYVEYGNGDRELYDLVADPYQLDNLAGLPEHATIEAELAQRLVELRE